MSTTLKLSLAEYEAMVDAGAFESLGKKRIELIEGELLEMSPQGPPHLRAITYLNRWSISNTSPDEVAVIVQGPIRLPGFDSEPEPDIAWCRAAIQKDRHPEPPEVMLLIEVGHDSLRFDLGRKARLYAQAGIADYWVVDVAARIIHVLRQPTADGYQDVRRLAAPQKLSPLHFPHLSLAIAALFDY